MSSEPRPVPEIPGYDIAGQLTTGGMGEVYLARRRTSHGFEKLCAIKTIRYDRIAQPEIRSMFLDEARLTAQLDHPALAHVYDFGEAKEVLYLAMEFLAGLTFEQLIADRSIVVPPVVCAQLMSQIARGLHAAHELKDSNGDPLGVIHRDISPGNLHLSFSGTAKLLDFGIALRKQREAPVTAIGVVKGKPTYMAPEQLMGDRLDRRVDIYSASIVLYEILTGKSLFTKDNLADRWDSNKPFLFSSSDLPGHIPPQLGAIVEKGLAHEPAARFENAHVLAVALENIAQQLGGETLPAFAERALADERKAHEARLECLLHDRCGILDRKRLASGVGMVAIRRTIPAATKNGAPAAAARLDQTVPMPPDSSPEKTVIIEEAPPSTKRSLGNLKFSVLLLLVVGLAAAFSFLAKA